MKRWVILSWSIAGVVVASIGLMFAFTTFRVGDSYCGAPLYDTTTVRPCASSMTWRSILALLCGAIVTVIIVGCVLQGDTNRRFNRLTAIAFLALAVLALLVMLNRLLQPATGEWCGSLLNRHRTYEPAIEKRCDELLTSHRNTAIAAGVAIVVFLGLGIETLRRGRRNPAR